ncbi:MAG: hypothetical protein KY455_06245 [Euryarchaeota archaeon]|nr:hypothetical protein [Euryarchaeota archaeon]
MERLWLTEPERKTALADVTGVRGDRFTLDRGLYAPESRAYRHPQPADRGVVWLPNGEKRKLVGVFEEVDVVWHRLRDAVPTKGDRVQCHLDVPRRTLVSRAHTALHLFLLAMGRELPPMVRDPEVQGGGTVRITCASSPVPRERIAAALKRCDAWCREDRVVRREPVPHDLAEHRFVEQRFQDPAPYPGPETTLEGVFVDGVGGFPCDGTHVGRTSAVGRIVVRHAHVGRGGDLVIVLAVTER